MRRIENTCRLLFVLTAILSISCSRVELPCYTDWFMMAESASDPMKEYLLCSTDSGDPVIERTRDKTVLTYKQVKGLNVDVQIVYTRSCDGKAVVATPYVTNNQNDCVIRSFTGPILTGLQFDFDKYDLLVPYCMGAVISEVPEKEETGEKTKVWDWNADGKFYQFNLSSPYPWGACPTFWYDFFSEEDGLYISSHDSSFSGKKAIIRYLPDEDEFNFGIENYQICRCGESKEIPSTIVYRHQGDWHEGARYYRKWYDSCLDIMQGPKWLDDVSGWFLAIMKQQNNEVIFPYESLGTDIDRFTDELGINMVGVFGWGPGGHDRFYPEYYPDSLLGGEKALRAGIAALKAKGKHVIMYANGQLIDQNGTEFWEETGKKVSVMEKGGFPHSEEWHKYSDTSGRRFGTACLYSEEWKNSMLDLAMQAYDLGADGILYDQFATTVLQYCYSQNHGHNVPEVVHEKDRALITAYLKAEMSKVDPDFIILTEGLSDALLPSIALFHGGQEGVVGMTQSQLDNMVRKKSPWYLFPQMFRYTFPEMRSTLRIQGPVNMPHMMNYGTVFGLRNEIEARYAPDVEYLKTGEIPTPEDYGTVLGKPSYTEVPHDPSFCKEYCRKVSELQRKYSDLLWKGRFVDNEGFILNASESCVMSSSFENGNRKAVVVSNVSADKIVSYNVEVKGYNFVEAYGPDGVIDPSEPLMGNGLAVLVYEK